MLLRPIFRFPPPKSTITAARGSYADHSWCSRKLVTAWCTFLLVIIIFFHRNNLITSRGRNSHKHQVVLPSILALSIEFLSVGDMIALANNNTNMINISRRQNKYNVYRNCSLTFILSFSHLYYGTLLIAFLYESHHKLYHLFFQVVQLIP